MKLQHMLTAGVIVTGIVFAAAASAKVLTVNTLPITLNGANEVPANASTATGSGTITINTLTNTVSWDINQNVSGATQSHIHGPAPVGVNAGIIRPLHTGTVPGHMVGSYTIGRTPVDTIAMITSNQTYVNIHSAAFPGGEIRGQIMIEPNTVVPSMSQWGILLLSLMLGAAGVAYMGRRRREA